MKRLDKIIRKNGFDYTLVDRTDTIALYCQRSGGGIVAHELFKIEKYDKEYEVYGKKYQPKERFPCNTDFGFTAWSISRDSKKAYRQYLDYVKLSSK